MGADFHARLHDMLRAFGASGSHWDAALYFCGDRFLLARPMPSSSPMACIAVSYTHLTLPTIYSV